MNKYLQVFISAENKAQADAILSSLLEKKIVAGGMFLNGPARFWWKGKIADMDYWNLSAFTSEKYKQTIIEDVKRTSVEEVPMIWFVPLDGNSEFLDWIEKSL